MYVFNMNKLFHKTPVELPKQPNPRKKRKSLLHAIVGGWYVNKLVQKLQPLQKRRLRKKSQKSLDEIQRILTEANQYWNDWKFHIHWNKLEWVNPRSRDERKNKFCLSSKKYL